jgi:beta-N-acetylhexosaminidase
MIDLAGLIATPEELARFGDPRVGGLILFGRNFASVEQLTRLIASVRAVRPELIVAVDHEGGRVQRFRSGFTRLPAMRTLGEWHDREPAAAVAAARDIAYVLAIELRACGVDLSFAPVLDLAWGRSGVIGDRSLHRDPEVVIALAAALIEGFSAAGMGSCGKHFPGHGWAEADSHVAIPTDERDFAQLAPDLAPFRRLPLAAIMPAHVIYPKVDSLPAGFSPRWHAILRKDLHFDGVVFSDDLSMEGASAAGDILDRVNAAWSAGCDMLLVCNAPDKVGEVLDHWHPAPEPLRAARLDRLRPTLVAPRSMAALSEDIQWCRGESACRLLIG